jgi:hypothetical protein
MGLTLALLALLFFVPILVLMKKGEAIREKQGTPKFNRDL